MGENTKFQANFKWGEQYKETLFNVYGNSAEEFQANLEFAVNSAQAIVGATTAFAAAYEVLKPSDNRPPQAAPQAAQQQYQQPAPQQGGGSAPNEPAPTCAHGEREWKDFVSKAGKPIKGWFCKVKDSDCKPLWRN